MAEEKRLAKEAEMAEVFARIKLGEREYQDQFPDESYENFPYYDSIKNKYFRYSVGDISKVRIFAP